jgi:hypothetical protein
VSSCSEQQNQTQQKDEIMRIMIMLKEPLQIRSSENLTDFVTYPSGGGWFIKISERPIMQEIFIIDESCEYCGLICRICKAGICG